MMWKETTSQHRELLFITVWKNAKSSINDNLIQLCQQYSSSKAILYLHHQIISNLGSQGMSSLLEDSYTALPLSTTKSQPSPPIQSYQLRQSICEVETELLIQTFDDRILAIVTQNGKVGCLVSFSIFVQWLVLIPCTKDPSFPPTTNTSSSSNCAFTVQWSSFKSTHSLYSSSAPPFSMSHTPSRLTTPANFAWAVCFSNSNSCLVGIAN